MRKNVNKRTDLSKVCPTFNKSCGYAYKLGCRCNYCKEYHNSQRHKDTRAKERARLWRLNNLERSRANAKNYQLKHPDKVREWQYRKYGITTEQYESILIQQNNVCAICCEPEKDVSHYKRLAIDHCHYSNKVRGLLCSHCNTGLGKFRDSPILLKKAARYLEEKENGTIE